MAAAVAAAAAAAGFHGCFANVKSCLSLREYDRRHSCHSFDLDLVDQVLRSLWQRLLKWTNIMRR